MSNERIFGHMLVGEGIEIGALNHPMPVVGKVRYVDYKSTEALRSEYPELERQQIANVDIVSSYEKLSENVGSNTQDFIIANQIIEHFHNPMLALREFHKVLKVGGLLHLSVPDKRVTFDCDRPVTSLQHLIEDDRAYGTPEQEIRDRKHYDEFAALAARYMGTSQPMSNETRKAYLAHMADAEALWKERHPIHYHVWTDRSWTEILNYLNENGVLFGLHDYLNVYSPTERNEFILVLKKSSFRMPPLPAKLPAKGPFRMKLTAFARRASFLHFAKYLARRVLGLRPHFRPSW
jgi:SAM-dependent methyltransferase